MGLAVFVAITGTRSDSTSLRTVYRQESAACPDDIPLQCKTR